MGVANLDPSLYTERRDVVVPGVWPVFGGCGPIGRRVEGSVSHEDIGTVGGGAVAGHCDNLLRYLVNVDLQNGRREGETDSKGLLASRNRSDVTSGPCICKHEHILIQEAKSPPWKKNRNLYVGLLWSLSYKYILFSIRERVITVACVDDTINRKN